MACLGGIDRGRKKRKEKVFTGGNLLKSIEKAEPHTHPFPVEKRSEGWLI
jgi:hypothetical protein